MASKIQSFGPVMTSKAKRGLSGEDVVDRRALGQAGVSNPCLVWENTMVTTTTAPAGTASHGAIGPIVLLGRFLFVLIFLMSAPRNFMSSTIAYAASHGVPMASIAVPFSGLLAILGGLMVLLGFRAKIGAWLLVLFLVGVTPMMHNFWAVTDPMMRQLQFISFMKNVSMCGAALVITQLGAGPWTLDARR
jgi:putative oxidoreductase